MRLANRSFDFRRLFGGAAISEVRRRLSKPDPGLTEWCRETAEAIGLPELARRVRVGWNSRMQTTAGRAWWPDRTIELNPKLREVSA